MRPLLDFDFGAFPIYQTMLCIAFFVGYIILNSSLKNVFSKFMKSRIRKSFLFSTFFGVVGANVANWFFYEGAFNYGLLSRFAHCGFSFYFGLLTFFVAAALFLRLYKQDVKRCLNIFATPVMMMQFISRFGCSLRGCCYGKTTTLFGLTFDLPVRELEATLALTLFIVLCQCSLSKRAPVYLFSYSLFRLVAEFFRGDDRGSIFGITALTPTQLAAIVVALVSGGVLFTRPIAAAFKKEEALDAFFDKLKQKWLGFKKKLMPKRGVVEYQPLPDDFTKPIKLRALRIIATILLIVMVLCSTLIYFNPLGIPRFEGLRNSASEALGGLLGSKTNETALGDTNGITLYTVTDDAPVTSNAKALKIVESVDDFSDLKFEHADTQKLENGNTMYVFTQVIEGKPVIGKNRLLITDGDKKPLYVAGDAAAFTYSKKVVSFENGDPENSVDKLSEKIELVNKKDCWYDSGKGLVAAYSAEVVAEGKETDYNVIVEAATNILMAYNKTANNAPLSLEGASIHVAAERVVGLLEKKDAKAIEKIRNDQSKKQEAEKEIALIEKTLCDAFAESKLEMDEFAEALKSAEEVAKNLGELNKDMYREILCSEISSTVVNDGEAARRGKKHAKKVRKAFEKNGIEHTEDEVVTQVNVEDKPNTFEHTVDYSWDSDLFNVVGKEKSQIDITITSKKPITVEIATQAGDEPYTLIVDGTEMITVVTDGKTTYNIKVTGTDTTLDGFDCYDYQLMFEAISWDALMPYQMGATMALIKSSYDTSNMATFASIYAVEGKRMSLGEAVGAGVLMPVMDSCSSCITGDDVLDSAKSLILVSILPEGHLTNDFEDLRDTTLEYVDMDLRPVDGNPEAMLIKARIQIKFEKLNMYEGNIYLKLEKVEVDNQIEEVEDESGFLKLLDSIYQNAFCITEINTDALFAAFDDTRADVKGIYDINAIKEYVVYESVMVDGKYNYQKPKVDLSRLPLEYMEQANSFNKYLLRREISSFKMERESCRVEMNSMQLVDLGADVVGWFTFAKEFKAAVTIGQKIFLISNELGEELFLPGAFDYEIEQQQANIERCDAIIKYLQKEMSKLY